MSWTDDELKKLEKQLYDMYHEAGVGLTLKGREFLADLQQKDEWRRKQVADGEWTEEQYKEWRRNKLLYAAKFKRLTETIKRELLEVNQKAIQILNGETPRIFAHNYNSVIESFPDSPVEGYTFELVDAETVKKLAMSGELMLPPKKKFDPEKDKAWNGKQLNAQILQGILQGESIPKIAARMADICDGNGKAMVRTARTMVTAAENSGRIAGMNKAEESGMVFEKIWISAVDSRTRDTHIALNGTKVKNGEMFRTFLGNELEFPGDWRAPGYEVYNCRCTLGTHFIGFKKGLIHKEVEKPKEKPKDKAENKETASKIGGLSAYPPKHQKAEEPKLEQKIVNSRYCTQKEYDELLKKHSKNVSKQDEKQIKKHIQPDGSPGGYVATHNYAAINSALRDDGYITSGLTEDDKKTIEAMRRAISANTLGDDYTLTRYVNANYLTHVFNITDRREGTLENYFMYRPKDVEHVMDSLKDVIGNEISEKAFISTSMIPSKNVISDGKAVCFTFKASADTNCYVPKNKKESECILGENTRYRVDKISKRLDNVIEITATIL